MNFVHFLTLDVSIERSGKRHLLIIAKAISMQDLQRLRTNLPCRITDAYWLSRTLQYHMINYPVFVQKNKKSKSISKSYGLFMPLNP